MLLPRAGSAEAIPATVVRELSFALVGQCAALHEFGSWPRTDLM